MATDAPNYEQILQNLVNRFLDIQVSLPCILEDLRNLVEWRESNKLVFDFDDETGILRSVDELPPANNDENIFLEENADFREPRIESHKIFCLETAELVTERVKSLAQTRLDIDQALSELPEKLLELLPDVKGNTWSFHVRRFCLLPLDFWPRFHSPEARHTEFPSDVPRYATPTRVDRLLKLVELTDPEVAWREICWEIDSCMEDLLTIAPGVGASVDTGGEELQEIPVEFISKGLTKSEIARLHSGRAHSNASQYLKRLRPNTTIEGHPKSKLWHVDIREWPKEKHEELLP